ncbi:Ig-like domain (group 2), partial [Eubacterium uniforme]
MKALLRNSLITFITVMSISCIGNVKAYAENTKTVKFGGKKKNVTLYVGEKLNIKVKKYTSSSKKKKLVFKSNNKKVTVTKKGIIAAKKTGSAKVTVKAKNSNKKTIIKVKVKKAPKDKVVGLNYKVNWRYKKVKTYNSTDYIWNNGILTGVKKGAKPIYIKQKTTINSYKLSWLALDGADGYEVQRWHFVTDWDTKGHWETIKDTKKTSYKITDFAMNELAKIKIKAYNIVDGEKVYNNSSGTISIRTEASSTCYKEPLVNRWKSEEAFYLQNKVREKAGVDLLKWDEDLYTFACYRVEGRVKGYYKDHGWVDSMFDAFTNNIFDFGTNPLGENYYSSSKEKSAKDSIVAWQNSKGHYESMISKLIKFGAIAMGSGESYAVFTE